MVKANVIYQIFFSVGKHGFPINEKKYRHFLQINLVLSVKPSELFLKLLRMEKLSEPFFPYLKKKYILSLYVKTEGIRIKGREMALI